MATRKRYGQRSPQERRLLSDAPVEDPNNEFVNPANLQTEEPLSEQETMPDYFTSFVSSRVQMAGYDPGSSRLYVKFVKPEASGGTPWTYHGVPPSVWRNLLRSKSPGKFVNRVLTPSFRYNRGQWNEYG